TYNNNSAHVEYLLAGAEQGEDGQFTFIRDDDLRKIVQTIPEWCSFIMIADCCRSGALVEGANEIFEHSTNTPRFLWELKDPSSRDLEILITACQNDPVTFNFFLDGKPKSFFLHTLMVAINCFGTHTSNRSLVEQIRSYMTDERVLSKLVGFVGRIQQPELYCNSVQASLCFLSLEIGHNVDPPSDENSGGNGGGAHGISEGSHGSSQAEAY
ncbi:metacaspase-8-like, partial [Trifolium medium]|nr:metacaspase-8-like [Trifolium medium]